MSKVAFIRLLTNSKDQFQIKIIVNTSSARCLKVYSWGQLKPLQPIGTAAVMEHG